MASLSFQSWKSRWVASLIDPFILILLESKPCWGGEIIEFAQIHLDPDVKIPTIYAILAKMEKQDFIVPSRLSEVEGITRGIPRKYYELTDEGQSYLNELKAQIHHNLVMFEIEFVQLLKKSKEEY